MEIEDLTNEFPPDTKIKVKVGRKIYDDIWYEHTNEGEITIIINKEEISEKSSWDLPKPPKPEGCDPYPENYWPRPEMI